MACDDCGGRADFDVFTPDKLTYLWTLCSLCYLHKTADDPKACHWLKAIVAD